MVDPTTLGTSLVLGAGGVYLLNRYRHQRADRLRTLALIEKYSSRSRLGLHQGRMRLLVSMPQVGDLPLAEQQARHEREERRERNYLELGLLQEPDENDPLDDESVEPTEDQRVIELEARAQWMEQHEPPLEQHAAVVAEESADSVGSPWTSSRGNSARVTGPRR